MGVSSPRSHPHNVPPALTVVAGLDHFTHFPVCPLLDIVHLAEFWPTPTPSSFYFPFYDVRNQSGVIISYCMAKKSKLSLDNVAKQLSFNIKLVQDTDMGASLFPCQI